MEFIDVYDLDRNKTGKVVGRDAKLEQGEHFVVIHLCIINSKGQMLIQQRHKNKKTFPEIWDLTVGGAVVAGETSRDACHRELLEELGLDIDFSDSRPLYTFNFKKGFDDIYVIERDVDIEDVKFPDGEVQAVKWATRDEMLQLLRDNKFIPYYESLISFIFDTYQSRNAFRV